MGNSIDWDEFNEEGEFPQTKVKFTSPGDRAAGTVTNVRVTDFGGSAERTPELWLRTDEGIEVSVVASQTNLRRALSQHRPKVGDRIAIVYTGDGQSARAGFSPPKLFEVAVKRADDGADSGPVESRPAPSSAVSADSLI